MVVLQTSVTLVTLHVAVMWESVLSSFVDCRHAMLPMMLTHVNDLLMYRFELELCIRIISDIVDLLFETDRLVGIVASLCKLCANYACRLLVHKHSK